MTHQLEELFELLVNEFETVKKEHEDFINTGKKLAEERVRQALFRIRKISMEYKKESVQATKSFRTK